MKRPWVRRYAVNGRRYRSATDVTLGDSYMTTVTPNRCPPGMVPSSRGCIRPTKGPSIIQKALGALGLDLPAPGAPEPLSDCGCGCKGAGTCGQGMGNIKSWKNLGDIPMSTSVALVGAGVAVYLLFFRKH